MPRLALDLPDDLRRAENSRENGESRAGGTAARTRTATVTDIDDPKVARWHRCWAGDQ